MIDWNVILVELEGYFLVELDCIVDKREFFYQNRTTVYVKVQWKQLSLDEETWELESDIQVAYPYLF